MLELGVALIIIGLITGTGTFILLARNMINGLGTGNFGDMFKNHLWGMIAMAVSWLVAAIGLVLILWQFAERFLTA